MMFNRSGKMPKEEIFSRSFFGLILIVSSLFDSGRYVAGILGVLFFLSAVQGVCWTCVLYRRLFPTDGKSETQD